MFSDTTPKRFRGGTVRSRPPKETLEATRPFWREAGITRVANITGLDSVGIPTVQAIRPNARSLSVSQGKGLDLDAARTSAVMEALELFHAESPVVDLRLATVFDMQANEHTADLESLPRAYKCVDPQMRMLWTLGDDLISQRECWVPFGTVTMDLTLPLLQGSEVYPPSSNGLASGNNVSEATVHSLCELIERDAYSRFYQLPTKIQFGLRLDLGSVAHSIPAKLLNQLSEAGLLIEVWDLTSLATVPTFLCAVLEQSDTSFRSIGIARGCGTHIEPPVALSRALTEAAQSRLTRIAGARDDIQASSLQNLQRQSMRENQLGQFSESEGDTPFCSETTPDHLRDSFEEDIDYLLSVLREQNIKQAIRVDLSRPGWPISVVRMIVPGLEAFVDAPSYRPGERAKRDAEQHGSGRQTQAGESI